MLDESLVIFVTESLPDPPARLLEIGAGSGELADHLTGDGYDVVAIDPASQTSNVRPVALDQLDAADGSFDAALAVVSLHHVEPLEQSCARLAEMLKPGALLVIDEFDIGAFDVAAASWWLAREPDHAEHAPDPQTIVDDLRGHLHPLSRVLNALEPWFEFGAVQHLPYLYRWGLDASVRPLEEDAIEGREIPATGARVVGRRR